MTCPGPIPLDPAPALAPLPRVRAPGLLLIGSASRDAGKTLLATRLIERFGRDRPVVGVKVTAADHRPGVICPRGGDGCGACTAFTGAFHLTEELGEAPGKDTSRLREAGASRVLWLRVRRDALRSGVDALLSAVGPDAVMVAESNTLRTVVDPDLFLMLRRQGAASSKSTAEAVRDYADRAVSFDGERFDLDLAHLSLPSGRWQLDEPATGIVLAGGQSRRMGQDKRALVLDGSSLLARVVEQLRPHVGEVILGANDLPEGADLGLRVVPDREPGQGPLMGLVSCLHASSTDRNLVAACDLPELPPALLRRMLDEALRHEAVVPRAADGRLETLLSVYRRRLLPDAEALLRTGERRIRPLFPARQVCYLTLSDLGIEQLPNLNTPGDVASYLRRPG